jgi:acylpyruvate hydrolase
MKIICIGRNYSEHAKELKNAIPSKPMFFLKPDSAVLPKRNPLFIPEWTQDLHYEVELVYKVNRLGKYISVQHAHKYYDKVGIGIDFTARDIQEEVKAKGHPWEIAKAFDGSAAIGSKFLPLTDFEDQNKISFQLKKNGELVQDGLSNDMIFDINQIIAYVSQFMTLKIGDLIFTGTPSGVGKVNPGDRLEAFLEGQKLLKVDIK